MREIITLVIICGLIYLGYSLIFKETWQGVYYPNGCLVCEDEYIFSPIFKTKEECLDWVREKKMTRNNENDLYECGKNCDWESGLIICEETVD